MNYTDKRRIMESCDEMYVMSRFPGSNGVMSIDGCMYLGFDSYAEIQQAFKDPCREFTRRMVDPYALHTTISRHLSVRDLERYFSRYGPVHCIVDHESTKGRYAFVNFMTRSAALCALRDGEMHAVRGSRVKIRGKVLSAAEPYAPAPYSPARLTM